MSEREPRRYWDACAFIALLTKEENRWGICERLLKESESGRWTMVTSTLTLAESCRKSGVGVLRDDRQVIEDFFERSTILLVTIDRPLAIAARRHMFDFNLQSNDAVHVAAAQRAGATILYTYDKKFLISTGRLVVSAFRNPKSTFRTRFLATSSPM